MFKQTERALLDRESHTKAFEELKYGFVVYLATLASGWVARHLELVLSTIAKSPYH